eukprot:11153784-Alexandrium_andersonii.AAC.1
MGGAPSLAEGATPPSLSEHELSELRTKALLALGRPALGPGPGLVPEFFGALLADWAGDPD